jgi:hypothetical protein
MKSTLESREYIIKMPSQDIFLFASVDQKEITIINVEISYTHPTTGEFREVLRRPSKESFSMTHFEKELDAYIVQEAMVDLTDNKHVRDFIE